MPQITLEDLAAHRPDVLLPPDAEFSEEYRSNVEFGRRCAKDATVALVAICRNAMPWLPQTLQLVEETGAMFREWSAFIYENDSADDTKECLMAWADHTQRCVSLNFNGRPHLNGTIATERTVALAEYRTACQRWVSHGKRPDYVIVFDTDAWGGWSVDGVATSIAEMVRDETWYGLASYSWCELPSQHGNFAAHYDAFAARLNHWNRRDQNWFHQWHPAVGSPPVQFNSAFGQLAVYDAEPYLSGTYSGDDCEHVSFHRSIAMRDPWLRLGLNPASRCVSFWCANGG